MFVHRKGWLPDSDPPKFYNRIKICNKLFSKIYTCNFKLFHLVTTPHCLVEIIKLFLNCVVN